ncbi:hypothetical protein BZM27_40540 [Paraburkholderia steynii]|uniref:Uncharacterized protein n=1 Tax=Paraburkholderia steynii TaxID=1245441 RepID=A0A4R0X3P6_9BURK|nr:hypothetical protein BZM27_40540 [Paraburkholderia steynii]
MTVFSYPPASRADAHTRPQQGACRHIGRLTTHQAIVRLCVPRGRCRTTRAQGRADGTGERPHFDAADSRNAHCWVLMRIVRPDIDGSDAIPYIFQGDTNEHARQEKRTD